MKNIKRGFNGFSFIPFFFIPVLIGFVSPGFISLIKRCLFMFYFRIKPKRRMYVFSERGSKPSYQEINYHERN